MTILLEKIDSFGRVLLYTQSSMTQLLELYYHDQICVHLVNQGGNNPTFLKFFNKSQVLPNQMYREVILYRQSTNQPLVYAISLVYLDHLTGDMNKDLLDGRIPIGKIIDQYQMQTYRVIKKVSRHHDPYISQRLEDDILYYKYYTIYQNNLELFDIFEFFPRKLIEKP